MIRAIFVALIFSAALSAISSVPASGAGLVIGTFDTTRATTGNIVSGNYTHDVLATINSQYPGTTYVTFPTITAAALSGVDVLIIASDKDDDNPITPLSASEQSAMLNFVEGGGRALLLADGYDDHVPAAQSMVGPFGLTIADDGHTGLLLATPTATPNPIIDGPFGTVSAIGLYGAGIFTNLGPYATNLATQDVTGKPILASIDAHALSPTSGRVVMYTDSTLFIDDAMGGFYSYHDALFKNTMQYLAPVPEPGTVVLAAIGFCGLLAGAVTRRRKARKQATREHAAVVEAIQTTTPGDS